jgi:hypothetical protein
MNIFASLLPLHINISNISKMTINVNRFQLHCFLSILSRQKVCILCCVRRSRSDVPFTLCRINIQSRAAITYSCTKGITWLCVWGSRFLIKKERLGEVVVITRLHRQLEFCLKRLKHPLNHRNAREVVEHNNNYLSTRCTEKKAISRCI